MMKLSYYRSHHYGEEELKKRDLFEWLCSSCESSSVEVSDTKQVQKHFRETLTLAGWSGPARLSSASNLTVFSLKSDLAFQIQMGNISRCAYDLLKIQHLYQTGRINAAVLVLPTQFASKQLSTNTANSQRVWNEVQIFNRILTIPLLILAIE